MISYLGVNSLLGIALPFWNFHFPTFLKSLSLYFVLKHLVRHPKFNKITLFIVKKFSPSVLIQIFLDLFKTIFVYYRRPIFRALCGYWVNIFILIFFSCFFPITMFLFVCFNFYLRFSFFWLYTGLVNALGWTLAFSEAVISCFISRPWFLLGLWETIFFFSEALAPK